MRRVSIRRRRRSLVRRHHLAGGAVSAEQVARDLVALHATDPASVYLSVLARSATTTVAEVAEAMYGERSLVRWLAMRRTLFVFPRDDVAMIQAAVSTPLAAVLRRRLISQVARSGGSGLAATEIAPWLADLEQRVVDALERRGSATGAQLRSDEPGLDTLVAAPSSSQPPQHLTTSLLTLLSADGRIVRGIPTGPWTSRLHRWEPVSRWWPDGLPDRDRARAQHDLARRWLSRFGPALVDDLRWWTGWTRTTTREVLGTLEVEEVDLHGRPGMDLARSGPDGDEDPDGDDGGEVRPCATLLPALDPTPMGWQDRDWFLGVDRDLVFDRAGNIGPTLWWDGEIVGSWAVGPDARVRTVVVADRGAEARDAVHRAAARLQDRLEGTVVTPAVRTPLEQGLAAGHPGVPLRG